MPRLVNINDSSSEMYPSMIITSDPVYPAGDKPFSNIYGMYVSGEMRNASAFDLSFLEAKTLLMTATPKEKTPFRVQLAVQNPKRFTSETFTHEDIKSLLLLSPNFQVDPLLIAEHEASERSSKSRKRERPQNLHHYIIAEGEENLREAIWLRLQTYSCPLLPDWKEDLIDMLYNESMITDLHVQYFNYHTDTKALAVALKVSQFGLEDIITRGIKTYQLPFALDAMGDTKAFDELNSLSAYINHFAPDLALAVQSNVDVLFDPTRGDEFSPYFEDLNTHANRQGLTGMFVPQAGAVSAIGRTLDREGFAFVCGEMGVGKTVISASAPYIHARDHGHKGYRAIVLSPNIMIHKWKREIEERVPNADVRIIRTFSDLKELDRKEKRPERPTYFVISQTTFKTNYPKEPIRIRKLGYEDAPYRGERLALSRRDKKAGRPVLKLNRSKYGTILEKSSYFCPSCGEPFSEKPFGSSLTKPSKSSMGNSCSCGQMYWGASKLPVASKLRKVSPAWYINKYFPRGYFEYLLVDEAHEYKSGSTDIGKGLGQLINHTTYQMLMTGTLFGGKAIDLFYLMARLKPRKLKQEGMNYQSKTAFHANYGVTQRRETYNQVSEKTSTRTVERPGINPSLYPMYLMGNAVFLDLADLGYALPPYEEEPMIIPLDSTLEMTYAAALEAVQDFHSEVTTEFKELHPTYTSSTLLHQLNSLLDRPYARGKISVFSKDGDETVVYHADHISRNYRPAKYTYLLDLIREEKANGRKVLVYAKDVDADNPENGLDLWLQEKLNEDGISTGLLRASGKDEDGNAYPVAADREKWLKGKQQEHDWDVLVVNPSLVKVGLDMLEYKTIVFYQFGLSAFEYMQASRRSWRIRQDQNIRVVTFAYQYTPQQYYLELLATKIDAALTIQGKMSDEGMRSMSESSSDLNELAKSIMNGDKLSSVNTVHDRFRNLNQTYDQLTRSEMITYDSYKQNPDMDSLDRVLNGEPLDIIEGEGEFVDLLSPDLIDLKPDPVVFTIEEAKAAAQAPTLPRPALPRKRRTDAEAFADLLKVEKVVKREKKATAEIEQFSFGF